MVVLGLIPVLLFAGYTIQTLHDIVTETSRSILVATTRDYVDRIDTWVRRGIDHVGMGARMPALADAVAMEYTPVADWDPLEDDLESLSGASPVFIRSIALCDLDGEVILQWPESGRRIGDSRETWFRIPLLTAEPTFQLCLDEQEAGQLVFSAPLIRGREPVGVLRIGYHLAALQHLLSLLTEVARGPSFVAIVSHDGILLASDLPEGIEQSAKWIPGKPVPLPQMRAHLPSGTVETVFEVEFPYMGSEWWTACLHPLEATPWNIVYFLPSERYLAPLRQRIVLALFTTGFLAFLLMAMGFASARVLSRNLQDLTHAARGIAAGDLNTRVPVKSRDEIGLLARSFNYMARNLSQRTKALIEARHQAEAASRAKSNFLSVMSHEVRTPLNSIIGYSDLLMENRDLSTEQFSSIRSIHRSGTELLGLLNNMLDFTRLEAGKVEVDLNAFPVLDLFSDVIEHTAPEALKKNLEIVIEPVGKVPVKVIADGPKIRQILLNLVTNALKFTRQGGVRIYFEVDFKPGRELGDFMVMVEDTGIGITPEVRQRLFKPFSQGDPSITREFGGTGLGLAISQYMAHACGGELTECSPPRGGASFALSVPVRREGSADLPPPALRPELRGKRVHVLSANPLSRKFLEQYLSKAGLRLGGDAGEPPQALVFDEPARDKESLFEQIDSILATNGDLPVLHLHPPTVPPVKLGPARRRRVLAKPVLPHELLSRMNALLSPGNSVTQDQEES